MKKIIIITLLVLLALLVLLIFFFFVGNPKKAEKIEWGVNFSDKHATGLGLEWKKVYLALMDDLAAKKIKLAVHWDMVQPEKESYYFEALDWMIEMAEERKVELLLVVGMKTPRWPECHLPSWAEELDKDEQQEYILAMIREIVSRYRNSSAVWGWQVENEPFFSFGQCPWRDNDFLEKEIALVKSLDQKDRPVIISDSGEISLWFEAAKVGDIVGTTLYRKAWFHEFKTYVSYPLRPVFYARKAALVEKFFGKKVICAELQAEPWGPKLLYDSPLEEQNKTMNLEQFRKNIEFAEETGFDTFYLWGAEWWYWLKEKHDQPEIWQEARKIFQENL
jgi:aryl-phospho-beta-D-glucosidase BglC (GH1 family)